jgi:AcrR family transcriptional regulator
MSRMTPKDRRADLMAHALAAAEKVGYLQLTRHDIAERAGVTDNLVTHYFGTMDNLRRDVMRAAIKACNSRIVGQGLAMGDKHARKAPEALRAKALAGMM